jgi:F-type H+-transporting ATPase subunit a
MNCVEGLSALPNTVTLYFVNILFDPITSGISFFSFGFSLFTLFLVFIAAIFTMVFIRIRSLVYLIPFSWVRVILVSFSLIEGLLRDNLRVPYFRYMGHIWLIFVFILFANTLGLIPFFFTVTSHFAVTLAFSGVFFFGFNLLAIRRYGWRSLNLFVPAGCPASIRPFLIFIEFVSYVARIFSLSIRLFANMTAGHSLLKILAGYACFILFSLGSWFFVGFAIVGLTVGIVILEFFIAALQAYVFTMLLCVYLNDVLSVDSH